MTALLFADWIQELDKFIERERLKFLLLPDDAISHIAPVDEHGQSILKNVRIHFLPPTTTIHLQPMDGGIIKTLKSHYRRYQLTHRVDQIDDNREPKILISDAIRYMSLAWNDIRQYTAAGKTCNWQIDLTLLICDQIIYKGFQILTRRNILMP